MKMSWGKGIALTYIIFIAAVLILVAFSFTKEVNLVTDDYYEKEIKYEEQIEKLRNTEALSEKPLIIISGNNIEITFPSDFNPFDIAGDIHLYRPSDNRDDKKIQINPGSNLKQIISGEDLANGLWKIKLDWEAQNKKYFFEKIVILN